MAAVHNIYVLSLLTLLFSLIRATHFRGGTLSWRPMAGNEVQFSFKMAWTYGRGPGCQENKIGQFVHETNGYYSSSGANYMFRCKQGCGGPGMPTVGNADYYCVAANKKEAWEQGENKFTYTFQNPGQFTVGFVSNGNWANLEFNKGGGKMNLATSVDLRTRSDTGRVNSSPYTLSKALYKLQWGCDVNLKLPVKDPDGDDVRCRWSTGAECESICNGLPNAILDQKTCTLRFLGSQGYKQNSLYGVALTIEDFPKSQISLDGTVIKTPSDALSSIPLQFLIRTPVDTEDCDYKPQFVSPTPQEKDVIIVEEGDTLEVTLSADTGNVTSRNIANIEVFGPASISQTPLQKDKNNVYYKKLTWATTPKDVDDYIVCATPKDNKEKSGDERCFFLKIVETLCKLSPCQNGGTCVDNKGSYSCTCYPGYTGVNCQTDINECGPSPCQNGATCKDRVNGYSCVCATGYTGKNCSTDLDDCQPDPCHHGATCVDQVNGYFCTCAPGYTGRDCDEDVDDCQPSPCHHSATCTDKVNGYSCTCAPGYTGNDCDMDIDDCASGPCKNGATCIDQLNSYVCFCAPGFTGPGCHTNIDDCARNPCINGGVCGDQVADFECQCPPGFNGKICQLGFDFCLSSPCKNGGKCVNSFQGPVCKCASGYGGLVCGVRKGLPKNNKDKTTKSPLGTTSVPNLTSPPTQTATRGHASSSSGSTGLTSGTRQNVKPTSTPGAYGAVSSVSQKNPNTRVTSQHRSPSRVTPSSGIQPKGSHHNGSHPKGTPTGGGSPGSSPTAPVVSSPTGMSGSGVTGSNMAAAGQKVTRFPQQTSTGTRNKNQCPTTEFTNCECYIAPAKDTSPWLSQTHRSLIAGFFGILIGLGLSVLTFEFFSHLCMRHFDQNKVTMVIEMAQTNQKTDVTYKDDMISGSNMDLGQSQGDASSSRTDKEIITTASTENLVNLQHSSWH